MTSPVSLKILAGPVSAFISQDLKFGEIMHIQGKNNMDNTILYSLRFYYLSFKVFHTN